MKNESHRKQRYFGMTISQLGILGATSLIICVVLGIGIALLFENSITTPSIALVTPIQPSSTPVDTNCRSEAAIYIVDIQPQLHRLVSILEAESPLPDKPQSIKDIRQIGEEIRTIPIPSCALSARDIFLRGLERYANAASNLLIDQDLSAYHESEVKFLAEVQMGIDQLQALAEGRPIPTPLYVPAPPSPTPRPPTAVPQPTGIGVSLSSIQSRFDSLGYNIERSSDVRGQPRYMGRSPNGLATLEVIGPANDLTQANITIGVPADDQDVMSRNAADLLILLDVTIPDWGGSHDWFWSHIETAIMNDSASTT